jgi:hypothetical protein
LRFTIYTSLPITFFSCVPKDNIEIIKLNKNLTNTITVERKNPYVMLSEYSQTFLHFDNEDSLSIFLSIFEKINDEELFIMESNANFSSMYSLFNKTTENDAKIGEQDTTNSVVHCEEYYLFPNVFENVSLIDGRDTINFLDINCFSYDLTKAINQNGIIKIGNIYYRYTRNKIFTFSENINCDLMTLENNKIIPENFKFAEIAVLFDHPINSGGNRISCSSAWSRTCSSNSGRLRILLYQGLLVRSTNQSTFKGYFLRFKSHSLRMRLRGAWYDSYDTYHTINANVAGNTVTGSWWDGGNIFSSTNQSCQNRIVNYAFQDNYTSNGLQKITQTVQPYTHNNCNSIRNFLLTSDLIDIRSSTLTCKIERRGESVSCTSTK